MTYQEALRYLSLFTNYETSGIIKRRYYNLARIKKLSSGFGNPHKEFKTIHIAGTKGKGSTANFVASILARAGFKAGLYTSPHIISERERIRINGIPIEKKQFVRHVVRIKKILKHLGPGFKPSYFEIFTQIAFNYFAEQNVDFGVFEVGLGGRLDATNIIEPVVTGITPVSFDHMEFLGHDLVGIATEKSAIIKRGSSCVCAPQKGSVLEVVKERCGRLNVPIYIVGKHIKVKALFHDNRKEVFNVKGLLDTYRNCEIRLLGFHQILNCAGAIGIVEALKGKGFGIEKPAIIKGIKEAAWPGRLEVAGKNPYVVLDGAQNAESAFNLKKALVRNFIYRKIITILGFCRDKDMRGVAAELADISDMFILTKADMPRAASPDEIEKVIKNFRKKIIKVDSVKEAYEAARRIAGPSDMILVTGSFYVIGELKKLLKRA